MRKISFVLSALAALFVAACSTPEANPVLSVEGGKVQGVPAATEGVTVYKGIPYAAAPVGENRWKEPQPVTPWEGVKVADTFSAACPQAAHDGTNPWTADFYYEGDPEFNEDCLYLNVWTTAPGKTDAKMPVAMWIHGGGYSAGWGFEKEFDGDAYAQRGVVLVTINYRLGIFGFLAHPLLSAESSHGVSGNYGTLDQIAALKWVYNNIEQFGGDPNNITIFGQSAGAMSVKNLVASPLTENMIAKAIIQSGGGVSEAPLLQSVNVEMAELGSKLVFDWAGYDTIEKMRAASTDEIYTLGARYTKETGNRSTIAASPLVDGYVETKTFDQAAKDGSIKDIPYMIGYTMDDMGSLGGGIDRFCLIREAAGTPAYAYQFARPLPDDEAGSHPLKGSFHSSELWYTFHTLARSDRPFVEADDVLSNHMVDCWANFIKTANPNAAGSSEWTPFVQDNQKYMVFKLNADCTSDESAMGDPLPPSAADPFAAMFATPSKK